MTKPEREALREYVSSVCAHVEAQGTKVLPHLPTVTRAKHRFSLEECRQETGARLNAADDRLRALGMLP